MISKSTEELLKENEKLNSIIADLEKQIVKHKKLEETFRESEEKYRSLYENAPLPYQSLNDDGSFRDVNPAWLKTLGYERVEVIGKFYKDFLHPEWQPHFEKNFPEFKKRGYVHDVQFKIRHKDGHYIDISFEGCIGYYPDGSFKQTYCVFQDITANKLIEKTLEESEEKFRSLFEYSPLGKSITGIDGSLKINKAFSEILGYSLDDLKEKTWQEITHPDDIQESSEIVKSLLDGNATNATYEKRYIHKNGNLIWTEVTTALKRDKNNQPEYFLTSISDITDRKKAKEAQEKQNVYIKMILDNLPIGVATNEIDSMKVTYMNRKFSEIYGWPEDEFPYVGKFFEKVFPDLEYRERMQTKILADISSGDSERMNWDNLKITTKSGEERIVHAFNIPLASQNIMVSTVHDITERKIAEEKLKESGKFTKKIIESMSDGFSILDDNGVHIDVNLAFCNMTGFSKEELIGVGPPHPYWPEEEYENIKEAFVKTSEGNFESFELVFKKKNGKRFPVSVNPSQIKDDKGYVISRFATVRDITERKQTEEELKNHQKYLEELVNERTKELDKKNKELNNSMKVFVGRELTIRDLQKRIKALEGK